MGRKYIIVLNDEAHHCYRHRIAEGDESAMTAEERAEAEENSKAARIWIGGLQSFAAIAGIGAVYDLSATPPAARFVGFLRCAMERSKSFT